MNKSVSERKVSERWVSYWPKSEQPRERLIARGADALSDAELLAIFLRVGVKGMSVVDLSRKLLQQFGSLRGLFKATEQDLRKIKGMGTAKIATLQAIAALSERCLEEKIHRETFIESSKDVHELLYRKFRDLDQEVFSVIFLDTKHRMLGGLKRSFRARSTPPASFLVRWSSVLWMWEPLPSWLYTTTPAAIPNPATKTAA